MLLGTDVCLGSGDFVFDGYSPPTQFLAYVATVAHLSYC